MDLTKLSSAAVSELISLIEKKQSITLRIQEIDQAIVALIQNPNARPSRVKAARKAAAPKSAKAPEAAPAKRGRRGALKDSILTALQGAGATGIRVEDMAREFGVKAQNIHVWFATTGKKIAEISKLAPGHYAWGAAAEPSPEPAPEPEPFVEPTPAVEAEEPRAEVPEVVVVEIEETIVEETIVELDAGQAPDEEAESAEPTAETAPAEDEPIAEESKPDKPGEFSLLG